MASKPWNGFTLSQRLPPSCALFALHFLSILLPSPWRGAGGEALFSSPSFAMGLAVRPCFPLLLLLWGRGFGFLFISKPKHLHLK